ncbi:MAG: SDR family oxidoreductase [Candidatus Aminicenantes bacterium]|nr:SDR family oxidoreductase [Candidatus Aminicenantes bacterium]MDH5466190.1 SDR family oxidoreductase [Candidatus Aminicenantes bacterium]
MNIAVTGASGHIGANLCRELLQQGHSVRALVHKSDQGIKELPLEFMRGDLMDPSSLSLLVRDIDIVFHLAAVISIQVKKKEELFEKNVGGTQNILKAASKEGVKRFIHFSSIHALAPEPFDRTLDESRPLALADRVEYSRSKALAELAVREAVKEGLDAVVLNPTAVIGPFDYAPSLLGRALILMYQGKIPALVHGGYDWVDVRDVVQASVAAVERGKKGERYLLSGYWKTLGELAELIYGISGRRYRKMTCSAGIARVGLPFLKVYCRLNGSQPLYTRDSLSILQTGHKEISCDKAGRCLGFNPRPIEETLRDTFQWFEASGFMD